MRHHRQDAFDDEDDAATQVTDIQVSKNGNKVGEQKGSSSQDTLFRDWGHSEGSLDTEIGQNDDDDENEDGDSSSLAQSMDTADQEGELTASQSNSTVSISDQVAVTETSNSRENSSVNSDDGRRTRTSDVVQVQPSAAANKTSTSRPAVITATYDAEQWVHRRPLPARGDLAVGPWPAVGRQPKQSSGSGTPSSSAAATAAKSSANNREPERVLEAARCHLVRPSGEVHGRVLITTRAVFFDPDPPEATETEEGKVVYSVNVKPGEHLAALGSDIAQTGELQKKQQSWSRHVVGVDSMKAEFLPGNALVAKASALRRKSRRRRRRRWLLPSLRRVLLRRYRLRESGIEIFVAGGVGGDVAGGTSHCRCFFLHFSTNHSGKSLGLSRKRRAGSLEEEQGVVSATSCAAVRDRVMSALMSVLPKQVIVQSPSNASQFIFYVTFLLLR